MNPFTQLPASDTPKIAVYRAPCQYQFTELESTELAATFLPQWIPDTVVEATVENTTDAKPE